MPPLAPGLPAPEFSLPDQTGKLHSLRDLAGGYALIYFYPKDDTPSCTRQACDLQSILPQLNTLGVRVVGISPDSAASHAKFAKAYGLTFPLLVDLPDESGTPPVINAYGAWGSKSMYGRTYMGVVRTTYLVDPEGRIEACWSPVRVPGHAQEIAARLNPSLGSSRPPTKKKAEPKKPSPKPARGASHKKSGATLDAGTPTKKAASAKPKRPSNAKPSTKGGSKPAAGSTRRSSRA